MMRNEAEFSFATKCHLHNRFYTYSLISIRQNYNFDMLAMIWDEIVCWFLKIYQDLKHSSFDGLIQEDIDLSNIFLVVPKLRSYRPNIYNLPNFLRDFLNSASHFGLPFLGFLPVKLLHNLVWTKKSSLLIPTSAKALPT